MIIAYPLEDIRSYFGGKARHLYQKKGVPTRVINIKDNMAILENKSGDRFPVNTGRIIWYDTLNPASWQSK